MGYYDRQELLDLHTDMTITCVGCGGIGYWVSKYLAMSGIKTLYLYDPDTIEESNLNRVDIPEKLIGRNKADIAALVIRSIRPDCDVNPRPFKLQNFNYTKTDWIVDCTDNYESQLNNYQIAKDTGTRYTKAGYDGEEFSINDCVAEWGETEDSYIITPSWVVPATIVAALTVAKVMKYTSSEISSSINRILV